ncbi:hypothetical protein F66182_493 [Fusarium sp. NRRL 66182]|nr:hypothetical protein F66182_493 [Fusarium sp. NRRL 66182]
MKFFGVAAAFLATLAAATPTTPSKTLDKRATTWCDAFGSLQTGGYSVYHNNWGSGQATSGSQCTTFNSYTSSSKSFSWSTSWSWAGGNVHVKSYSNIALERINKKISDIKSIATRWTWRYSGTNMVSNVSYDLWLAPSVGADNKYEIMIWVGSYGGAGPISDHGSNPLATVNLNGVNWRVFRGPNGGVTVYSFVATSNQGNFQGDLLPFLTYLTRNQGVPSSYVATSFQAGTEPFVGSNCVFATSAYTISVS